jgi:sporulation protein YabP
MLDEKRFASKTKLETAHNIIMENREKMTISGVEDVESFDEETVVLFTQMGLLTVKGSELRINKLNVDTGEVIVEGNVDMCQYSDENRQKGGGFLKKLFK